MTEIVGATDHPEPGPGSVRKTSSSLVLETILQSGDITMAQLAKRVDLPPTTVAAIVARLLSEGIVSEVRPEHAPKNVGRPPKVLRVNRGSRLVLAADVEPDRLRIALADLSLDIVAYAEHDSDRFADADTIVGRLVRDCRDLLSANDSWRDKLVGMAVSLPGVIDVEAGIAVSSTNMPKWRDVRIVERLSSEFGLPVAIGKSYHLAALSERWRRPEIIDRNVLCLVLRTGVGVALLVKGSLYLGASRRDGEIGHTIVDLDGAECECGNRGCLENFISPKAIRERAVRMIQEGEARRILEAAKMRTESITPELVYRLAREGDPDAVRIVTDVARYLGLGAANLVQVLNVHEVVICGSIDVTGDLLLSQIRSVFDQVLLPAPRADVTVMLSPFSDRASLYGAAVLAIDRLVSKRAPVRRRRSHPAAARPRS